MLLILMCVHTVHREDQSCHGILETLLPTFLREFAIIYSLLIKIKEVGICLTIKIKKNTLFIKVSFYHIGPHKILPYLKCYRNDILIIRKFCIFIRIFNKINIFKV